MMKDPIERQVAIDACHNWDDGKDAYAFGHVIVERIQKLPSAQRWIPVSESLPEEDTDVLISYRYKEGEGDASHAYIDITSYGDMYFGGRKVTGTKHWRQPFEYFTSNYEVVAWMPLPKPWKGEEGRRRMKDPIERQDAIDAINGCMDIYVNNLQTMIYKADAYKALTDLPSAQSETCEGCKHSGKWENEVECGYSSPCTLCKRRVANNYER